MKTLFTPIFLFFYFCFTLIPSHAAGYFEFTLLAKNAYNNVMHLRFDEANSLITEMKRTEPDNLMVNYIENFEETLKVFISESKPGYENLSYNVKNRIKAVEKGDAQSPYFLFTRAQMRLLHALNSLKFSSKLGLLSVLDEVSTAYGELETNMKKFPDFMPNKMSLGALHALVGAVPDNYRGMFKFVSGMNGTIAQGQSELEEVITYSRSNDFIFEQETLVMYALLILQLNNDNDIAWAVVNNGKLNPKDNPLACFAMANVAMRTGRNDKAVEFLQNRPTGTEFFPMPYLDFMLGSAKLYRGDTDAKVFLQRFLNNFSGHDNIKTAYQRLAWHALLYGDSAGYMSFMEKCKTQGRAEGGNDKNAMKEAKAGIIPEGTLLAGRLLFDGGYYSKAEEIMIAKNENQFSTPEQKLEWSYRLGRILQMLKRYTESINYYDKTIKDGHNSRTYFPCNAALQLGLIYETLNKYAKAREFYNYCLSLNPDDHADALHTKAKVGLSRLKGK